MGGPYATINSGIALQLGQPLNINSNNLVLIQGQGSLLSSVVGNIIGEIWGGPIFSPTGDPSREYVLLSFNSGDTLNVMGRGLENTTPKGWSINDNICFPFTSGMYQDLNNQITTLQSTLNGEFTTLQSTINGEIAAIASVPTGTSLEWNSAIPPAGFFMEDGSIISQATYPLLYSIIGNTFNTGGEAPGSFRLPNSMNRLAIGAGSTYPLASTGGSNVHTNTINEMVSHDHGLPANLEIFTAYPNGNYDDGTSQSGGGDYTWGSYRTNYNGSGLAYNIMNPYIAKYKIIKF